MKKCVQTILFILTIIATACTNSTKQSNVSTGNDKKSEDLQFVRFDTIISYSIDTLKASSPKLTITISLDTIQGADKRSTLINNAITYAAYGIDSTDLFTATAAFAHSCKEEYYTLRPDYINEKQADHTPAWLNHTIDITGSTDTGRDSITTYTLIQSSYTGGAHGLTTVTLINFDNTTGREIHLQDIFKENFEEPLTQQLLRSLAQQTNSPTIEALKEKGYTTMNEMYPTENFRLDKDSITFIYNSYEIAPYSMGLPTIRLSYDEIKDIMK